MLRAYFIFGWAVFWAIPTHASVPATPQCAAAARIRSLVQPALREAGYAGTTLPANSEITCPAALDGTETLEVASVRWDGLVHSIEVRVRCTRNACLPFVLHVPPTSGETIHNPGNSFPVWKSAGQRFPALDRPVHSLVRPGEIVTLLWEEGSVRMTRTMVCLDRGDAGERVRTRGKQGGHIVRGRVLATGLVKAE